MDLLTKLVSASWDVVLALAPWVLLGAAVAGVLHAVLPKDFVRRHLGRGRGSVTKAVALGVPLPLCSCGVIPTGLGLRKDGASRGASVGFLISTPQTGVDSVLVSAAFLGWPFALFKVGAAAVTGVVGGWLTDRAPSTPEAPTEPLNEPIAHSEAGRSKLADAWEHGVDVLRTIWGWLLFGVLVSAILTVAVPASTYAALTGHGPLLAMLAMLLVSLPLYVCATASVPIAAALVAGGFPPGAALVFLMAGPATNLATIGAVYRSLGRRALGIYLSTIILGSLAAGFAFDFVLDTSALSMPHAHNHAGTLEVLAGVVLLGAFGWFGVEMIRERLPRPASGSQDTTMSMTVEGMSCGGCARKLTRALLETEGVTAAEVDHETKLAVVHGAATTSALRDAVAGVGYTIVDGPQASRV